MQKNNNAVKYQLSFILIVILLGLFLSTKIDFSEIANIDYLQQTILAYGPMGPIIFIMLMASAIIISPIPSLPLAAAAGIVWGPVLATFYAVIGAEIGAIVAFLIARHLGRKGIEKMFKKDIAFCDKCNDKSLFWIILVARLFPFFQFDIISYGAGLTNMKLKSFAIATFIGMIPMTYVFASFGRNILIGNTLSIVFSIGLIIGMFAVPMIIKKYNLFKLRDKLK